MSYNCPICDKAGLPDYTKNIVVCPQCNSELKAFLLLHSISKLQKSKIATYIIMGLSLLTIAFSLFFLKSISDRKELISKNAFLNDNIANIQAINASNIIKEEDQSINDKQDVIINYIVKKGDYPYRIAQFFYGDGRKYKQIEADNNLEQPYILKVGQVLIIKISQE